MNAAEPIVWTLPALSCGHCANVVRRTVLAADPQAQVDIDLVTRRVELRTSADRERLASELTLAGYPPAD